MSTPHPNPSGLCVCGCGLPAPIARCTAAQYGHVKGQPTRYIVGHNLSRPAFGPGPNPGGLCQCGCGRPTPIARKSAREWGHVRGTPVRFLPGHNISPILPDPPYVIDESTGCWPWLGTPRPDGHGSLSGPNRVPILAHRHMYQQLVGPIPEGLVLHHTCERPICVNPAHLQPMTQGEHMRVHVQLRALKCGAA